MIIDFLGITVEGDLSEADLRLHAVNERIKQISTFDGESVIPPDLNTIRIWAIRLARQQAVDAEADLDALISGNYVRAIMLNTEIVQYQEVQRWVAAGRPAAPTPSDYPIAVAEAMEYGISTQVMLAIWEERAAAWEQASARIAAIERRALLAIEAAETIEAVAEALAGLDGLWPTGE